MKIRFGYLGHSGVGVGRKESIPAHVYLAYVVSARAYHKHPGWDHRTYVYGYKCPTTTGQKDPHLSTLHWTEDIEHVE